MNTIVMNTLTGGVTEYTGFAFHAITPTHAGSATGLFLFGGDTDNTLPIIPDVLTGKQTMEAAQRKRIPNIYYAVESDATNLTCVVATEDQEYEYPFYVRDDGVSRADPGKGIIESYLQVGLKTAGEDFLLDYIEANVAVTARRI
jgi:hypothetical protein